MCGESSFVLDSRWTQVGSPPHVWGKHDSALNKAGAVRITPTCVGKAECLLVHLQSDKDHPHMCGESGRQSEIVDAVVGSPPHVWGKLSPSSS